MKYEMIFGDESLFECAPFDCIFVVRLQDGHKVYYGEYPKITTEPLFVVQSDYITFAMRRIIKTPVWTVADQKAGRLPEVGSLIVNVETGDQFSFVGVNAGSNRWACKDACDGLLYFFKSHEMSPIETPREKYDRERDERIDKLLAKIPPSPITVVPAMKIMYEELRPFTGGDHD